jgi:hypothetical protein
MLADDPLDYQSSLTIRRCLGRTSPLEQADLAPERRVVADKRPIVRSEAAIPPDLTVPV